jgi:hypothetical protein
MKNKPSHLSTSAGKPIANNQSFFIAKIVSR